MLLAGRDGAGAGSVPTTFCATAQTTHGRGPGETLIRYPYLSGQKVLGHQREHVEEQLLHGMRGVDFAKGQGRA